THADVGDFSFGIGKHGKLLTHQRRRLNFTVRHQRANTQTLFRVVFDSLELRNFFDVDQGLGLVKPLLHEDSEMRASGKDLCFARILFEQRAGFSDRDRLEIIEVSHALFQKIRNPNIEIQNKLGQNESQIQKIQNLESESAVFGTLCFLVI